VTGHLGGLMDDNRTETISIFHTDPHPLQRRSGQLDALYLHNHDN
jgi:hypothetical protein